MRSVWWFKHFFTYALMTHLPPPSTALHNTERQALAQAFVAFAVHCGALQFGTFKTKAGRLSPYFFNAAAFSTGPRMLQLSRFYAQALLADGLIGEFDTIFGPAYKGIPLATALAMALAEQGYDLSFVANRKEKKDHGEGGSLVGAPLQGRTLVIDDVVSAGTALRASIACIETAQARPCALVIALDRQEKATRVVNGQTVDLQHSAVHYVRSELGLSVCAIATLDHILHYLQKQGSSAMQEHAAAVLGYRQRYGA